ncbi:MAG: Maf family protein [Planctomycetes bacterium]|nr:Maf family protein [Planctomycetota bacterium]
MTTPITPPTLLLASRSPRRAAVLREAGYDFIQKDPPFHDPPQPEQARDPLELARSLAAMKALSLRDASPLPNSLILAADTLCLDAAGRLIGQPADRDDARRILRAFMGVTHAVITGVALLAMNDRQPETLTDSTQVFMHPIADAELETYLDTQQWRGKAGAYNLFDRQAAGWVIDVHGDPTTVVGLPMRLLVPRLEARGVRPTRKPTPHHELFQA